MMSKATAALFALALAACGGAGRAPLTSMDAVSRVRTSPGVKDAERVAPQIVAQADAEQRKANEAWEAGDDTSAELYAQRSLASLEHAIVLARLARAEETERDARARGDKAAAEARELAVTRARLDNENNELEKRIKIARELGQTPVSGPADPKREAARKLAAESLFAQARLLCGAARLVAKGKSTPDLDEAEKLLAPAPANATGGTLVDTGSRARAQCLASLTKLRREAGDGSHADALLSELSATGHFDAVRDERGVVVTLRDAFDGSRMKAATEKSVAELGQVLRQHATYRAQVVVHDATKSNEPGDARAKAVAGALAQAAGIAANDVGAESAGVRLPVADPSDAKLRARNARLEIVFISPGN